MPSNARASSDRSSPPTPSARPPTLTPDATHHFGLSDASAATRSIISSRSLVSSSAGIPSSDRAKRPGHPQELLGQRAESSPRAQGDTEGPRTQLPAPDSVTASQNQGETTSAGNWTTIFSPEWACWMQSKPMTRSRSTRFPPSTALRVDAARRFATTGIRLDDGPKHRIPGDMWQALARTLSAREQIESRERLLDCRH